MASKRQLKKRIAYVCGELAGEILMAARIFEGADINTINKVVNDIASLQVGATERVSVAFDKTPRDFDSTAAYRKARRAYYRKAYASLRHEFGEKVVAIVKEMNAAIPADVRSKLFGKA